MFIDRLEQVTLRYLQAFSIRPVKIYKSLNNNCTDCCRETRFVDLVGFQDIGSRLEFHHVRLGVVLRPKCSVVHLYQEKSLIRRSTRCTSAL